VVFFITATSATKRNVGHEKCHLGNRAVKNIFLSEKREVIHSKQLSSSTPEEAEAMEAELLTDPGTIGTDLMSFADFGLYHLTSFACSKSNEA
jgi:hypothetical protein